MADRADYFKEYYARNRARKLELTREWKRKNRERSREHNKGWYYRRKVADILGMSLAEARAAMER